MPGRFYTSRKRAYRGRRDALLVTFEAAHDFLRGLEVLCDGGHGFHMGTSEHVQFYLDEGFLFHLAIRDADGADPRLEISSRHNGRLKEGTRVASHLLFRDRIHKVIAELALPGKAVLRKDDAYHVGKETPLVFFRLLQGELLDIVARGESGPAQQELFARGRTKRKARGRRRDPPDDLVGNARQAESAVATLVRDMEANLSAGVTIELGPEGALVRVIAASTPGQPAAHRAETLAEAVAAALAAHGSADA